jgi:hypothetical protein
MSQFPAFSTEHLLQTLLCYTTWVVYVEVMEGKPQILHCEGLAFVDSSCEELRVVNEAVFIIVNSFYYFVQIVLADRMIFKCLLDF